MYQNLLISAGVVLLIFAIGALLYFSDQLNEQYRYFSSVSIVANKSYTNVVLVCFQKDESDILDLWFRYHAALVGASNIIMIDNYSRNPMVLKLLTTWESRGVIVLRNLGPYGLKGDLCLQSYRQHRPNAELFFPIDIDEFLIAYENGLPVVSISLVLQHLDMMIASNATAWGFLHYYTSIRTEANKESTYFAKLSTEPSVCKKVFRGRAVQKLDHGNHLVDVIYGEVQYLSTLGYLHYHNRSPLRVVERALNDVKGFKYLPKQVTLGSLPKYKGALKTLASQNMQGLHKVKELIAYLEHGVSAFVANVSEDLLNFMTLSDIVLLAENATLMV